jgi:hypothetical protein
MLDDLGLKQAEADRRAKGKLVQSPSQPQTTDGDPGRAWFTRTN